MRRIDMHSHFLSRGCCDSVSEVGKRYGLGLVKNEKGEEAVMFGGRKMMDLRREHWDPEARIKDMDAQGVDLQILSAIPFVLYHHTDPEANLWMCGQQNDGIARVVKEFPGRFAGLAAIPLQEPSKAIPELDRAINKLGLCGIEVVTNTNGKYLDSPDIEPLYKEIEALDVPIYVHPGNVAAADRLKKYHLRNLIGNPLDTTTTVAYIIFSGILEKFPRLKFCFSHAGGMVPYLRGRWEHGYEVRPECKAVIKRPPSYYLPLLYFDTITHFNPVLEFLVTSIGAERVMLGTDYPADMADSNPVRTVQSLVKVSQADKEKIMGGNAARIFKL